MALLIGASGVLIYNRISGFIDDISFKVQPDKRDLILQKIKSDLIQTENKVYTYALTEDESFLDEYQTTNDSIQSKLVQLRLLGRNSNAYTTNVDTLQSLINYKIAIMDTILYIEDNFRVNRAFSKIEYVLKKTGDETAKKQVAASEDKKNRVFRKLFSRKKDSVKETPAEIQKGFQTEISKEFKQIKEQESLKEVSSNEKLLELKEKDVLAMRKINNLIGFLQTQSQKDLEEINKKARSKARETNYILALFIFITLILLGLVFYNVFNYIKRSRHYNKVLLDAKKDADELVLAKSRFLATMSHEIRTPMNAILGFSEQLSNSNLPEKDQKQVKIIHDSASFLVKIIDETLEVSKLDADKLVLNHEDFNLNEFFETTINQIQSLVEKKNNTVTLTIEEGVAAHYKGDKFRLKQILFNLLGNAVKFTENGKIEIIARTNLPESKNLIIEVKDTGIGMTAEEQSRIFNEYEQADHLIDKKFGGTGLGLPITKKLVNLFNGKITVISEKGKGSSFIIELPLEEGKAPVVKQSPLINPKSVEAKRILIADDGEFNRKLLKSILDKYTASVKSVKDGSEVIKALSEEEFDLILMDINMPVMDGIECIKQIRNSTTSYKNIPVLALTAFSEEESYYQNLGFNGLIRKPFKENNLLQRIISIFDENQIIDGDSEDINGLEDFKKAIGDNEEFYREMLQTFIISTQEGLKTIRAAFDNKNIHEVSEIAHRIAPQYKQLGADKIYEILKELEGMEDNKELIRDFEKYYVKLIQLSDKAIETIKKELNK